MAKNNQLLTMGSARIASAKLIIAGTTSSAVGMI
jgi:hypothetical protein